MPEVNCPEHGVFAYRSVACPGCAQKAEAARHQLAVNAKNHYESEIQRVLREIAEKKRRNAEQVREAEKRLNAHDRTTPEPPNGLGAFFKQAAYERENSDFLTHRAKLTARLDGIKIKSAEYEQQIASLDVAVHVMMKMIDAMPEATQLFIDEEQRLKDERLAAQNAKDAIAAVCAELDQRFGGTHTIGSADNEYNKYRLLGAVDIDSKRYARLQANRNIGRVYCVPWIDAFAELIGENILVCWSDDSDRIFRVSDSDGVIEDDEESGATNFALDNE